MTDFFAINFVCMYQFSGNTQVYIRRVIKMSSDKIIVVKHISISSIKKPNRELFLAFVVIMYILTGVSPNFEITVAFGLKFH